MENNSFKKGLTDGMPICIGYLSVSFAFGIFAVEYGMSFIETLLISMTNLTSAGQLAAVPIMAMGGTLIELAITQIIINLRYALMSVSLSQKMGKSISLIDRFIIGFTVTDEIFAVASSNKGNVGRRYMYGLATAPYIGWSVGTLLGAVAGNILPESVVSALGVAIYGMFIAIVVPVVKREGSTAACVLIAIALGCAFKYIPILDRVPDGFVIIISAVIAGAVMAVVSPIDAPEEEEAEQNVQ